jgi:CRISPR-associated protein Cas5d
VNVPRAHHPPPPLVVEVDAPFACFTRPEFKTERLSYPVMTPSAARGVLEAIFWKPQMTYTVTRIEVLKRIQWFSIRRNELQSMLTLDWVRKAMAGSKVRFDAEADRDQRNMVCLRDVAYRIHAQVRVIDRTTGPDAKYREQFRRRVDKGACFSQPFLGTREFSATFGKASDRPPIPHSEDVGVMLHSIDYSGAKETYRWFNAALDRGVMRVPRDGIELPTASAGRSGGRG